MENKKKKTNNLESCIHQHQQFSPGVVLVDGLVRVEAEAMLKCISSRLEMKWKQPYSGMFGYVNIRVAITLLRATHFCIWGSWFPAHKISVKQPQWEDSAGLHIFC